MNHVGYKILDQGVSIVVGLYFVSLDSNGNTWKDVSLSYLSS